MKPIMIGAAVAAVVLIILIIKIFKTPIKLLFKLCINTVIGFLALMAFNYLGAYINISIGISWINALIVGIFGVPGFALLLILKWLMII